MGSFFKPHLPLPGKRQSVFLYICCLVTKQAIEESASKATQGRGTLISVTGRYSFACAAS